MKMDITVAKKDHVNIGDFSSTEPNVSLTLKDVDIENFEETQKLLSSLVEIVWIKEFISSIEELDEMVNVRSDVVSYVQSMKQFSDMEMENKKEEIVSRLKELGKIYI